MFASLEHLNAITHTYLTPRVFCWYNLHTQTGILRIPLVYTAERFQGLVRFGRVTDTCVGINIR